MDEAAELCPDCRQPTKDPVHALCNTERCAFNGELITGIVMRASDGSPVCLEHQAFYEATLGN